SSLLVGAGLQGFGFFDFTIPGLFMAIIGLVYICFLLPVTLLEHKGSSEKSHRTAARPFFVHYEIRPATGLGGKRVTDVLQAELNSFYVLAINRQGKTIHGPFVDDFLMVGDKIAMIGTKDDIAELIIRQENAFVSSESVLHTPASAVASPFRLGSTIGSLTGLGGLADLRQFAPMAVAEVFVPPNSRLIGTSSDDSSFALSKHCTIIGREWLHKRPEKHLALFQRSRLRAGDVLIIQGKREELVTLESDPDLVTMSRQNADPALAKKAPLAAGIFAGVILCSAFDILNIAAASFVGALMMMAFRIISIERAFRVLDRKVIFVIASTLALGKALEATGGSEFLASIWVQHTAGWSTPLSLAVFFVLVAFSSNVVSTKVAAVLYTPIAIAIAQAIGVPVAPFAIAVIFGANCAFASPIGYQTNLLVMQTGQYRFSDFLRGGLPLLIIACFSFALLSYFWFFPS
ncbi:MAG: hypothetical protein K0U36_04305, partial [Alphaproteobacteria bacterium]|nr:hypothetical protein [Alphaproteobacteria bacterium]